MNLSNSYIEQEMGNKVKGTHITLKKKERLKEQEFWTLLCLVNNYLFSTFY